jgi:hypothetical protein
MSSSHFYSPEAVGRMTAVYKRAVQELKIERASVFTHERLARCILSIGNTHTDPHRLLDQSIRLYLRSPTMSHRSRMSINAAHGRGIRNAGIDKPFPDSSIQPIPRRYD